MRNPTPRPVCIFLESVAPDLSLRLLLADGGVQVCEDFPEAGIF